MQGRLALGAGAGALGLLALALWLVRPAGTDARPPPDPSSPLRAASGATGSAASADVRLAPTPLPGSLAGTEVDGGFVLDDRGRLRVTRDALDLFDYFLAASGEESLAAIRARIEREIELRLPPEAHPDALALLDRYLAYRDALRELFENGDLADLPLERRLQRIRELRRAHFSEGEREALFAAEEERWRVDVERQRVARDPDLSPEERERRLAALDQQLPEDVRETRALALAAATLREDEARMRAEGASDAEIHALREQRFGGEAANRLARLDQRRVRWTERVDAWLRERERLIAEEAPADVVARARAERFQGPELQRALALERIDAAD